MPKSEVLAVLGKIPELAALNPALLAALASVATLESVAEDAVIYREDERNVDVFYLISGLLESRLRVPSRQNMEEPFRTLKPGQLFGETAFLNTGRHGSTTVARERSLLLRLDGEALKKACDADSSLGYAIYKVLSKTIAERAREATLELRNTIGSF